MKVTVFLDGAELLFPDQQPRIIQGVPVAPISIVLGNMGFNSVGWTAATGMVSINSWQRPSPVGTLTMQTGNYIVSIDERMNYFTTNGIRYSYSDSGEAMLVGGRIMVPLQRVLETIGCQVIWDAATMTITINSNPQRYTVTFDANGGLDETSSVNVITGTQITLPVVEHANLYLDGWYTEPVNGYKVGTAGSTITVNSNMRLYAHWVRGYTITYDYNGGSGIVDVMTVVPGAFTILSIPTRSGYSFVGWFTALTGGMKIGNAGDCYTPTEDITLYARWSNILTVTYYVNGGSLETTSVTAMSGTSVTLPKPTRNEYKFTGWYTDLADDGELVGMDGSLYAVTNNISLYAQWREMTISEMLDNFQNSDYLSDNSNVAKKETMVLMGHVMAELNWKPAYIAGVLGYIQGEGNFGLFEGAWTDFDKNQPYMKTTLTHYPDYKTNYSYQYIYSNKDLSEVIEMAEHLETLRAGGTPAGFGIGCCQWSFDRALTLLYVYREVVGAENNYITYAQTIRAEILMVIRESQTNGYFRTIYPNWLDRNNGNYGSEDAAYDAGYHFLIEYGLSTTVSSATATQIGIAETRGNNGKAIYNAMNQYE